MHYAIDERDLQFRNDGDLSLQYSESGDIYSMNVVLLSVDNIDDEEQLWLI